jgi:hypothetical protein
MMLDSSKLTTISSYDISIKKVNGKALQEMEKADRVF